MTDRIADISLPKAAIVAGVAILIMTIAAVYSMDIVAGRLFVPEDPVASTSNIQNSPILFRSGILGWIIIMICDVLAAWGLYVFLRPVNKSLSLLMAWFRLIYVAILGIALLNFIHILSLMTNEHYITAFDTSQLHAQVSLLLKEFDNTWSLGLVVFGFHILLLGYLVLKSGYVPRIFGILLLLAFLGYLTMNLSKLLVPSHKTYITTMGWIFIAPMVLGEVGLGVWLLFRGVKVQIDL